MASKPMPVRLFNEHEALNDSGHALTEMIRSLVDPVIDAYQEQGYSLRDMEAAIFSELHVLFCERTLRAGLAWRKAERAKLPIKIYCTTCGQMVDSPHDLQHRPA